MRLLLCYLFLRGTFSLKMVKIKAISGGRVKNKLAEQNVEAESVCEFQGKTGDLSQSSLGPKGQQNLSCYLGL